MNVRPLVTNAHFAISSQVEIRSARVRAEVYSGAVTSHLVKKKLGTCNSLQFSVVGDTLNVRNGMLEAALLGHLTLRHVTVSLENPSSDISYLK